MEEARAENESLKEKINGLKQQYGPIGKQVYNNNHSESRMGGGRSDIRDFFLMWGETIENRSLSIFYWGDKPIEMFCPPP